LRYALHPQLLSFLMPHLVLQSENQSVPRECRLSYVVGLDTYLYQAAQARHPARWSGNTRNWAPCGAVTLNPERDHVVSTATKESNTQQIAA
jgi:hypothetical protein